MSVLTTLNVVSIGGANTRRFHHGVHLGHRHGRPTLLCEKYFDLIVPLPEMFCQFPLCSSVHFGLGLRLRAARKRAESLTWERIVQDFEAVLLDVAS